jgi:hypothetical protein
MSEGELRVVPVAGLPEFAEGMGVGEEIARQAEIEDGDVVVVSQKIVSKAEGQVRRLSSVLPGGQARKLAALLGKEPALVELILAESEEVLRAERGVLIVQTHHGFVCANAGIDSSNLTDPDTVCLLPKDPDASARWIREEIAVALAGESGVGLAGRKAGVSGEVFAGFAPPPPPDSPPRSGSSSRTVSGVPGVSARQRWQSDAPAWRRSTIGAGGGTLVAATSKRP